VPLERCDALPFCWTFGSHVDIAILVIRMLGTIDTLCCVGNFFPNANGRVKAGRRECTSTGTPGDASDRPFVCRRDLDEELKDGLDGSASQIVCIGAGVGWKVIRI
jgi:hypothetical protein